MRNSTKTYLVDRFHRSLSAEIMEELIDDIKDNEGWEVLAVLERAVSGRKAFMRSYKTRAYINPEVKLKRIQPGKKYKITSIK